MQTSTFRFVIIAMMLSMCVAEEPATTEKGVPIGSIWRGSKDVSDLPGQRDGPTGPEPPPGGEFPMGLEDPSTKELACWAVAELDAMSDSPYQQRPIDILSATEQVVAGMIYRLTLTVGLTSCLKGDTCAEPLEVQDCAAALKQCELVIVDQPWLPGKTITSAVCY